MTHSTGWSCGAGISRIGTWRRGELTRGTGAGLGRFHGAPDYQAPRRIVVVGDRIFVTLGFHAPVSAIDGATGRLLKEYPDTRSAGELIHRDGTLYVARNTYEPAPGKEIMAVDTETGKTLWRNNGYKGIAASIGYQKKHTNAFITAGEERLFLADENDIVALNFKDGREIWKKRMPLTDEIVGDVDYRYSNFLHTRLPRRACLLLPDPSRHAEHGTSGR